MNSKSRWLKQMAVIGLFSTVLAVSSAGNANNIVQNGDFNNTGIIPNNYFGNANVADWSDSGLFVVIYAPNGANTGSAAPLYLWGPADGIHNGLTATSPNGNNFLSADADRAYRQPLSEFIQVTPGDAYALKFDYAGAEYTTVPAGMTTEAWQVSLDGNILTGPGSATLDNMATTTPVLMIPGKGFSGWVPDTLSFIAPGSGHSPVSELLSFLPLSNQTALPPVALLDSVSIDPVPEPGSLMLLGAGVAGLVSAGLIRRRRCAAR
jgi:PEP-CTERM motif